MTAPRTGPELTVVGEVTTEDDPAQPRQQVSGATLRPGSRRLLLWLLVLALVSAGLLAIVQGRHARSLAARIAALESEIAVAAEQLRAYENHLVAVRTGVDELAGQLDTLRALVGRDPLATGLEAAPDFDSSASELGFENPGGAEDPPAAATDSVSDLEPESGSLVEPGSSSLP